MTRAKWKGPFMDWRILSKKKINPKLWCRSSVIPRLLVNTIVSVYNGCMFKRVVITPDKIGFKFGAFSYTRKFTLKSKKIKNKKPLSKKK